MADTRGRLKSVQTAFFLDKGGFNADTPTRTFALNRNGGYKNAV